MRPPVERPDYAPFSGYDPGDRIRKKVAQVVARKAGLWPGDRALQAACGPALAAAPLAKAFTRCRVAAVDERPEAVSRARANAAAEGAGARLDAVRASPYALPFPDETFQLSVVVFGLASVEEPADALAEVHRVTGFYGKLFVVEADLTRLAKVPRGTPRRVLDESLEDDLRDIGFGKLQRQKLDVLPGGGILEMLTAKRFDPDEEEPDDDEGDDDER